MAEHQFEALGSVQMGASVQAAVVRGQPSWTFLYIFVGFALTIEGTMASMIEPLPWWAREILFVAIATVTFQVVLFNSRVQDRILAWKAQYEDRLR